MPNRGNDRRWTWYAQVRDAAVALVGLGTLSLMAFRNSYPIGGVITALVCVGALSASAALRALTGRWESMREERSRQDNPPDPPPPSQLPPARDER